MKTQNWGKVQYSVMKVDQYAVTPKGPSRAPVLIFFQDMSREITQSQKHQTWSKYSTEINQDTITPKGTSRLHGNNFYQILMFLDMARKIILEGRSDQQQKSDWAYAIILMHWDKNYGSYFARQIQNVLHYLINQVFLYWSGAMKSIHFLKYICPTYILYHGPLRAQGWTLDGRI